MNIKEKWIIWGTGKKGQELYDYLSERGDIINVITVVDANRNKWGEIWNGYVIENPDTIKKSIFDKLIIAMVNWRQVYRYAIEQYKIQPEQIDNHYFIQRESLLKFYSNKTINSEQGRQLDYIAKFPLDTFNDTFPEKYLEMDIPVFMDETVNMLYVYYNDKKMYFPKYFNIDNVKTYFLQILIEQDEKSPHKYQGEDFRIESGETVLDIGAAEGNFSLDIIDKARKVYLVETDKRWIEALEKTFEPYIEKVHIIQKFVCDRCNEECTTIDELSKLDKFTSIKMDIEGAEIAALKGGENYFRNSSVKIFVCSYHAEDHYKKISEMLKKWEYDITATDGYMVFLCNENLKRGQVPKLVKGIVRARINLKSDMERRMKKVYIWGTGKYVKVVYEAINKDICVVEGIIDNDKTKMGNDIFANLRVESPAILSHVEFDYILISAKNYQPILADCKTLGIADDKILIFWENQEKLCCVVDEKSRKIIELEEQLQICKWKLDSMPYELGVKQGPKIKSSEELLKYIIQKKVSLCRFGDGELEMMRETERLWYQSVDKELSRRLKTIIHSNNENVVLAIANIFGNLDCYTEKAANAIRQYLYGDTRNKVMKFLKSDRYYFDAYVSRPYMIYKDKSHAKRIFDLFKKIWNNRSLLILEGENGKMGVGNDLLINAKKIRRIICPSQNAFSQYNQILHTVQNSVSEDELVIVCLGPTATVLAYDLGMAGIQALDIGQIDNEYEWFIRNVEERVEIPGKCVAELSWCHQPRDVIADDVYEKQIIGKITSN